MDADDWEFDPDDRPRPTIVVEGVTPTPAVSPTRRPGYDDLRGAADGIIAHPSNKALAGWFAVCAGGRCRWVRSAQAWFVAHGPRWAQDGGTVERLAKDSVWRLAAFSNTYGSTERDVLMAAAGRLLRLGVLRNAVELARPLLAVATVDDLATLTRDSTA